MTTLLFKINEKRKPKEINTTDNLVLTLGEEAFMSGIPGRTSPEPNKKGSTFNPGSLTVKKNNMLLRCINKKAEQNKERADEKLKSIWRHAILDRKIFTLTDDDTK